MMLSVEQFQQIFNSLPASQHHVIAYSGGLDSHVLLHLAVKAGLPCSAIYIDHGLQADSQQWALHCEQVCQDLGVAFQSISVNAQALPGESPEAAARKARYAALEPLIQPGYSLLTAQHQDDQAETLLLQLIRSAGPDGLAAMPESRSFGLGWQLRPLLSFTRQQIRDYADQQGLRWIVDPSNDDVRFDRNFLRHRMFPLLTERWPTISRSLSQAASLQAETSECLTQLARIDADEVIHNNAVELTSLQNLSLPRQANLIRDWLNNNQLDIPPRTRLQEILTVLPNAAEDSNPVVRWASSEVRRYQNRLYCMLVIPEVNPELSLSWHAPDDLMIPELQIRLFMQHDQQRGLSAAAIQRDLSVRLRRGGERIKPKGSAHTRELKKLLQQAGVPPWQRDRIPLLYIDDQLAAVAGYWVDEQFSCQPGDVGYWPVAQKLETRMVE